MKNSKKLLQKKNKNLRIVFIQPGYAHYRKSLFKRLSATYNLLFIFMRSSSNYPSSEKANKNWKFIFLNSEKNKFFIILLIRILLIEKYDIIVTSVAGSCQSIISYFIAKIRKKIYIIWNEKWYEEFQLIMRKKCYRDIRIKLERHVTRMADSVVVAGSKSLGFHRQMGIPTKKLFVANNSTESCCKKYNKTITREKLGIKNKYVILYLSRIISWKGLDVLISAFKKLENIRNDVFLLVGGDGEYRNYCEDLGTTLKVNNIKFLGSIKHEFICDYFYIADLFVLPSCMRENAEAWGLVINEAMSANKPIITTDAVGAAEDLVRNGINGYVVKNNNVEEMYFALNNIISGGDVLIKEMGRKSKEIYKKFNNYDKMFNGFQRAILYSLKRRQKSYKKLE